MSSHNLAVMADPTPPEDVGYFKVANDLGARSIPYRQLDFGTQGGVFVIPGTGGSVWEPKSSAIFTNCNNEKIDCTLMGYSDLEVPEKRVEDYCIVRGVDDACVIFDQLTKGPQIIVGSSSGANPAIKIALANPDRVKGLLLIAPGTQIERDLLEPVLNRKNRRAEFERDGYYDFISKYYTPYGAENRWLRVSQEMTARAIAAEVVPKNQQVTLECPVVVLHDQQDKRIPFSSSQELCRNIRTPGFNHGHPRLVKLIDAGHECSERLRDHMGIWSNVERMLHHAAIC